MSEIIHPFDCDCDRCTTHDEDGNEIKWSEVRELRIEEAIARAEANEAKYYRRARYDVD